MMEDKLPKCLWFSSGLNDHDLNLEEGRYLGVEVRRWNSHPSLEGNESSEKSDMDPEELTEGMDPMQELPPPLNTITGNANGGELRKKQSEIEAEEIYHL
ncbi:hypothetical protein FKM82_021765 [Ascaphus truei]